MARVTVEDCIDKAETRFELVMAAAQRARQLAAGTKPTLAREEDKNPVIALREIAEGTVEVDDLTAELIRSHRRVTPQENEDEEGHINLSGGQEEWENLASSMAERDRGDGDEEEDEEENEEEEDEEEGNAKEESTEDIRF